MFSILANEFKTEIRSPDDLYKKIRNAPIKPKPVVSALDFIYDWKSFIEPRLAGGPRALKNHTSFHSFIWTKEAGTVRFRGKVLPQDSDSEFGPRDGIQLVSTGTDFTPVGPAKFRIENLELDRVFSSLAKYFKTLEGCDKMEVVNSWDRLKDKLEGLPLRRTRGNLGTMKITDFLRQQQHLVEAQNHLEEDLAHPPLQGEVVAVDPEAGNLAREISVGMDVCIYTDIKTSRPWLGVVTQVLINKQFELNWYQRRGRGNKFYPMKDGSGEPVISIQNFDSVMFWGMSQEITNEYLQLSLYWMKKIDNEYTVLDLTLS